jgi:hypothetical protein
VRFKDRADCEHPRDSRIAVECGNRCGVAFLYCPVDCRGKETAYAEIDAHEERACLRGRQLK